ncbi:Sulfite exporter TauE/SafE family protein 3-like protein [Drosera capensis]
MKALFFEDDETKISYHLNEFNDVISQLESVGVRLEDTEAAARREASGGSNAVEVEYKPLGGDPNLKEKVSIIQNIHWKELGILFAVWVAILAIEISENYTTTCSVAYWVLNLLQVLLHALYPRFMFQDPDIPVVVGASSYEAMMLYKAKRVLASRGEAGANLKIHQLVLYCATGVLVGVVGSFLRLGGGYIMVVQVSSATATFAMTFSSSMSLVEYYLLKRFPVPYGMFIRLSRSHDSALYCLIFSSPFYL